MITFFSAISRSYNLFDILDSVCYSILMDSASAVLVVTLVEFKNEKFIAETKTGLCCAVVLQSPC